MIGFAARAATSAFKAKKKKPSRTSRKSSNKKRRGRRRSPSFGWIPGLVKNLLTRGGGRKRKRVKRKKKRIKSSIKRRHSLRWKRKYAKYKKPSSKKNKNKKQVGLGGGPGKKPPKFPGGGKRYIGNKRIPGVKSDTPRKVRPGLVKAI